MEERMQPRELYARRGSGDTKSQQKYLRKMARRGWPLRTDTGAGNGYRFIRGTPVEMDYHIDQQFIQQEDMPMYVERCAKAGWTFLYSVDGREHYFMGTGGTSRACFKKENRERPVELHGQLLAFAWIMVTVQSAAAAAAMSFLRDEAFWLAALAVGCIVVLWEMSRVFLFGYLRHIARLHMVNARLIKDKATQ